MFYGFQEVLWVSGGSVWSWRGVRRVKSIAIIMMLSEEEREVDLQQSVTRTDNTGVRIAGLALSPFKI